VSDEPILCEHGNSAFACCAPGTTSSLRAELAEARATIGRLERERAHARWLLAQALVEQDARRPVVQAAKALRDYERNTPASMFNPVDRDRLVLALCTAVDALHTPAEKEDTT
jgi:hypothetical protein